MTKLDVESVCLAILITLLCPLTAVHASSSPADSMLYCGVGHEQWRGDRPRPAAKRPANLNVGEPRTVRMVYFLPNDWPYRVEVVDSMKTVIREVETFYREQMHAHGYGLRTFAYETDAQGEPLVHRVDGRHPFSHYDNTLGTAVVDELDETFDLDANIYVIVLGTDALRQGNGKPAGGVGRRRTKNGGYLVVPDRFSFFTVAHELGHAFGLYHDFRDDAYIMSYGGRRRSGLSACAAEFLSVHTCFNAASPTDEGPPPTVEILSNTGYLPGTTSVPVRVKVSDLEDLHQVMLIGNAKPCRGLASENEAVVEFNYNGRYWEGGFSALDDQARHHLLIVAVDAQGNVSETNSFLVERSPYEIVTLGGPTDHISSVAFAPDGAILAAGASSERGQSDVSILLWDVERREIIATLQGHTRGQLEVAFSPDGAILASAGVGSSFDYTVRLWEVATRREFARIEEGIAPVAFSPDGATLAYVVWGEAIKLWDVARRQEIGTLGGDIDGINAIAFSPDGATLAAGTGRWWESGKGAVILWDVVGRARIATVEEPLSTSIDHLSYSPDGTMLAYGWWTDGAVKLWDVARREQIDTLKGAEPTVFSPDGSVLAFQANDRTIKLWNVGSRQELIALTGVQDANSLSYSPDGTMLASASFFDGTITLWDVSEWTGPRSAAPNPDFDGDGTVSLADFLLFAPQVGLSQGDEGYDARFDLDGNGAIGFSDFVIFAGAFGRDS